MAIPTPSYFVFVDKGLEPSSRFSKGFMPRENEFLVGFPDRKMAETVQQKLANENPSFNVHLLQTIGLAITNPGTLSIFNVNEKGEILPK